MSSRVGYALAVVVLLLAAVLRFASLSDLPPGLHDGEITSIRITETVRSGKIGVFFNLDGEGHEILYYAILAASTTLNGDGLIGYQLPSVWISLLGLALMYTLSARLYGPLAGLASMLLLAVGMWPILLSREVGREALLPLLVTAVMLALAYAFPVYRSGRKLSSSTTGFAMLGTLLGVGFYIHQMSLIITLASMLFIVYVLLTRRRMMQYVLSYTGFALLLMIIIAVPYLISTIQRPDLAAGGRVFAEYSGLLRSMALGVNGIFFQGDANPVYNLPGRPLIDLVSGLFLLVGLIACVRYWRQPRFALPLVIGVVLVPVAFLSDAMPGFLAYSSILPLVALFFGLGVSSLYNSASASSRRLALGGLVLLLLFNIGWTLNDLFGNWGRLPQVHEAYHTEQGYLARYLDHTAGHTPTIICDPQWDRSGLVAQLSDLQLILLMMNHQTPQLRFVNCDTGMVFAGGGAEEQVVLAGQDHTLFLQRLEGWLTPPGADPASLSPYRVDFVAEDGLTPSSVLRLEVMQRLADTLGYFTTGAPLNYAPEAGPIASGEPIGPPVPFGGNVTFMGYNRQPEENYRSGDMLPVITYWRIDGIIPPDLTIFIHILTDPATISAQYDIISSNPRLLENRDVIVQVALIELRTSMLPGQYSVSVGVYQDTSDERLPVLGGPDGQTTYSNRLFLYPITILDEGGG